MLTKTAINFGGLDKKIRTTEVQIRVHNYHFFLDKAILCSGLPVLCPEVHSCKRELQALATYRSEGWSVRSMSLTCLVQNAFLWLRDICLLGCTLAGVEWLLEDGFPAEQMLG